MNTYPPEDNGNGKLSPSWTQQECFEWSWKKYRDSDLFPQLMKEIHELSSMMVRTSLVYGFITLTAAQMEAEKSGKIDAICPVSREDAERKFKELGA